MVKENLNKLMSEIIDDYGRENLVAYTLKHKREASKSSCQKLETKIRFFIKIDGFRDPIGALESMLNKKVVAESVRFQSLEQAILKVWIELNSEMKITDQVIADQNKNEIISVFECEDEAERIENLNKIIDRTVEQLLTSKSYTLEEARLIAVYTICENFNKIAEDKDNNREPAEQSFDQDYQYEKVNLDEWYACLKILPASSKVWDEIDDFIRLTSELSTHIKKKRTEFKRLGEALWHLKEECHKELAFFEINNEKWSPALAEPEQYENLAEKIERLVLLFQQYAELRYGEMLTKTLNEEENRRNRIQNLEVEIQQLCIELSSQFYEPAEISDKECLNEILKDKVEEEVVSQPGTKTETDTVDGPGPIGDSFPENQTECQNELIADNLVGTIEVDNEVIQTEADIEFGPAGNCRCEERQTIEILDKNFIQTSFEAEHANETDEPVKFDTIYEEIQAACLHSEDIPKAWIMLKACQELYGNCIKIEALPTPPLMELYYLGRRIQYDPILYSTQHQKLDALTAAIKVADLSPAQAVMHFAIALPLVLAHAYDPLRASFFYADYIPPCFEPMYSMLVEQSNKVNVPIIDLCGAEQKQHQNDEQRRKIGDQIEQAFHQYSAKNKTSIDAFLFPRYGMGPLQWIRDGVKNQSCGPEFRDRLIRTKGDDVFALFTGKKDNSVHDYKLASITSVRGGAMDKIQHILNLASAWIATCDQSQQLDDFQYKAFKQLQLLFDENYEHWITDLQDQSGELTVASRWMIQSLEQLLSYMRGVMYAVEYFE